MQGVWSATAFFVCWWQGHRWSANQGASAFGWNAEGMRHLLHVP